MKKVVAIVFLDVGLGLAVPAFMNTVDYRSQARRADYLEGRVRSGEASEQAVKRLGQQGKTPTINFKPLYCAG